MNKICDALNVLFVIPGSVLLTIYNNTKLFTVIEALNNSCNLKQLKGSVSEI